MENILSTVITSSLVATITGATINAFLERQKARRNTRLDALTIAVALEGYAITCADKLENHITAVSSDGQAGSMLTGVPDLPQLSVVAGFIHPHKVSIADRILAFPQEVRQADQAAAFWWEVVGDGDAMRVEAVCQVAKIGLQSLDLAREIRTAFKLPCRNMIFGEYDVRKTLKKRLDKK